MVFTKMEKVLSLQPRERENLLERGLTEGRQPFVGSASLPRGDRQLVKYAAVGHFECVQ